MPVDQFSRFADAIEDAPSGDDAVYRSYKATMVAIAEAAEIADAALWRAGFTRAGRPIHAVRFAPSKPDGPCVLVIAGLHSMEHVGVATAVELCRRAADGAYPACDLYVVPVVNVDGFVEVERAVARNSRRFFRRNAAGVDLNRNFGSHFRGDYYLSRILPWFFAAGEAPLSEPETRAVDAVLSRARPDYAASLHAFGRVIYLPYAGARDVPDELPEMKAIAADMTAAQQSPYRVTQLGTVSRLFRACGAEIDHFYDAGALPFLLEIGAGPRLSRPETWLVPYRWFTPPPDLLEADVAEAIAALSVLAEQPPRRLDRDRTPAELSGNKAGAVVV